MRISISKKIPSTEEMIEILQHKFPDYSYKLFGLSADKSIIVKKSTFVGVQISRSESNINIEGSFPSVITSMFSNLLFFFGDVLFYFISEDISAEWKKLEEEVGNFIKHKYQ